MIHDAKTARSIAGQAMIAALAIASLFAATDILSQRQVDLVLLCLVALGTIAALHRRTGSRLLAMLGGLAAVSLALLQLWQPSLHYMPYLLIAPANLVVAYVFGRGLLPGRHPVLLEMVRDIGKGSVDGPRFVRFLFWQSFFWCLLTLTTAFLATFAMLSETIRAWATPGLAAVIAFQIGWFVLSHYYAAWRYGRTETWWDTLQVMARPNIWSKLIP